MGDKPAPEISPEAARLLEAYSWRGNVREVRNIAERALLLCEGHEILPEHLPIESMAANALSFASAPPPEPQALPPAATPVEMARPTAPLGAVEDEKGTHPARAGRMRRQSDARGEGARNGAQHADRAARRVRRPPAAQVAAANAARVRSRFPGRARCVRATPAWWDAGGRPGGSGGTAGATGSMGMGGGPPSSAGSAAAPFSMGGRRRRKAGGRLGRAGVRSCWRARSSPRARRPSWSGSPVSSFETACGAIDAVDGRDGGWFVYTTANSIASPGTEGAVPGLVRAAPTGAATRPA